MNAVVKTQPSSDKLNKAKIKSDLLYELITNGAGLQKKYGFTGWPIINGGGVATYGLTTWLVMRSLHIERFPWHPDGRFTNLPIGRDQELVRNVLNDFKDKPHLLEEACDDIRQIYDNTQKELRSLRVKTMQLSRSVGDDGGASYHSGYASRLLTMDKAARCLGLDSFNIPVRLLSSWGSGGYGNSQVDLTLDIPVEDIAWGDSTIATRNEDKGRSAIERGEWIVINRNLDGLMKIPVGSINNRGIDPTTIREFTKSGAESYLRSESERMDHERSYLCDGGHFAKTRLNWHGRLVRCITILATGKII